MSCALTFWLAGWLFTTSFVDYDGASKWLQFIVWVVAWPLWPMFLAFEINSRMGRK